MNSGYAQSQAFFESRYQLTADPWDFEGSVYERARYAATLAALSKPTYTRIYEPGCSVGVLTDALADCAAEVVACDISATAVARARDRCQHRSNVNIAQSDVRDSVPPGRFGLIVLSEIGYYFTVPQLQAVALKLGDSLEPGGEFVAVNWLGYSPDHLLHGNEVFDVLNASLPCVLTGGSDEQGFRIDTWRRAP